jgi:hypothetical protein
MTSSSLSPAGLSDEQLLHFSEHGWLALERVLDQQACRTYQDVIQRCLATLDHAGWSEHMKQVGQPHLFDPFFLNWFKIPGILEADRQLTGDPHVRLTSSSIHITAPHPERHERRDELLDPYQFGWHRDFTPNWGTIRHLHDERLIYSPVVVNVTFLTPVSPEDGATAFLDGSHRLDGGTRAEYEEFKDRCAVVQATLGAGSVVLFSEALLHSIVPIVSERTRWALFNWIGASNVPSDVKSTVPPYADRLADDELRDLFRPPVPESPG